MLSIAQRRGHIFYSTHDQHRQLIVVISLFLILFFLANLCHLQNHARLPDVPLRKGSIVLPDQDQNLGQNNDLDPLRQHRRRHPRHHHHPRHRVQERFPLIHQLKNTNPQYHKTTIARSETQGRSPYHPVSTTTNNNNNNNNTDIHTTTNHKQMTLVYLVPIGTVWIPDGHEELETDTEEEEGTTEDSLLRTTAITTTTTTITTFLTTTAINNNNNRHRHHHRHHLNNHHDHHHKKYHITNNNPLHFQIKFTHNTILTTNTTTKPTAKSAILITPSRDW